MVLIISATFFFNNEYEKYSFQQKILNRQKGQILILKDQILNRQKKMTHYCWMSKQLGFF